MTITFRDSVLYVCKWQKWKSTFKYYFNISRLTSSFDCRYNCNIFLLTCNNNSELIQLWYKILSKIEYTPPQTLRLNYIHKFYIWAALVEFDLMQMHWYVYMYKTNLFWKIKNWNKRWLWWMLNCFVGSLYQLNCQAFFFQEQMYWNASHFSVCIFVMIQR